MTDSKENKEFVNVFSKKFMGGPLGIGDPEDRTLRHLEDQIFITQMVKDRAHHEKCPDLIKKWGNCMEENGKGWQGYFTFYTCKSHVDEMNACLKHHYSDEKFREECTQIYLDKRARFRQTGVIEKDPYFKKPYYESERKKNFIEFLRKEKLKEQMPQTGDQK